MIRTFGAMSVADTVDDLVSGLVEIRTTFGTRDAADACAERLVTARLAACVQVDGPVSSTYFWQGSVERANEWRWSCKTTEEACEPCITAILATHDYETPQVVVVPCLASAPYAAWVVETVRPAPSGRS